MPGETGAKMGLCLKNKFPVKSVFLIRKTPQNNGVFKFHDSLFAT